MPEDGRHLQLHLSDGVMLVLVVDPQPKQVEVHVAGTNTITVLQGDDVLTDGTVLSDFKVKVREIFP